MCELMGLSFAKPIPADFSIREFALRSEENADGWGLGWYPDRSLAVVKEPVKSQASPYTGFLETYPNLQARVYVAHVRHKTTGGVATHADTHPFTRELAGRDYCFAHNGTLSGPFWDLPLGRFRPVGATDSEYLCCYLLDEMLGRPTRREAEADSRWGGAPGAALSRAQLPPGWFNRVRKGWLALLQSSPPSSRRARGAEGLSCEVPMAESTEALALGMQYHRAGHLNQAEQIYRQVLQNDASNADAMGHLADLCMAMGRFA